MKWNTQQAGIFDFLHTANSRLIYDIFWVQWETYLNVLSMHASFWRFSLQNYIRLIIYWILKEQNCDCFRLIYSNTSIKCLNQFEGNNLNIWLWVYRWKIKVMQSARPISWSGWWMRIAHTFQTRSVNIRCQTSKVNKRWASFLTFI